MERMLVVVFNGDAKAYEASRALTQLDIEGSITIHGEAVIKKNGAGVVTVEQSQSDLPIRTVGGTAIGALIGLLGGPVGAGIGAAAGLLAGTVGDLTVAGVDADYLDDISAALTPGKSALVADISEEWITPVDDRMEALGGVVYRTTRKIVEHDQWDRDVAELRAEIDQLKTEHAQARADRKAKLKAKIDELNGKLRAKLDHAKQRSEQIKSETEAKVHALEKKAEKAQGEVKASLDARGKQIRADYQQSQAKMKHALAGQLTAAAAKLEK